VPTLTLTKDNFADSAPTWAPDGQSIVYVARISGNEKLFRLDLASGRKTQLTFGTHDDGAAQWLDENTLVFASTATDPSQPIDPDVARNGKIYNTWTLNLKTGELKQYSDAVGGNLYNVVLKDGGGPPRVGVITYYKGEYELHTLERRDPIVTAASSDFGTPGTNIIDFQSPLSHTLVAEKKKKKGTFEKLFPGKINIDKCKFLIGNRSVVESLKKGQDPSAIWMRFQLSTAEFANRRRPYLLY